MLEKERTEEVSLPKRREGGEENEAHLSSSHRHSQLCYRRIGLEMNDSGDFRSSRVYEVLVEATGQELRLLSRFEEGEHRREGREGR